MEDEKGFTKDELIVYKLGRIESLLAELKDNTNAKIQQNTLRLNDHDGRLGKLEHLKYWGLGVAAGLGFVASLIKDFFFK